MANTNEVEQLNLQVGMDGANAQETLKLILGSLSGIQNKLLAIGKTPINIGGGYTQVTSDLKIIQEVMGKMTAQLKTNSTTWGDVAGYVKEYGKDIANAEAKVESLNKSITKTKNLEKELNQQKEFNNKLSLKYDKDALTKSKKAEADIAKAKNYNNNLAMKEQIVQIKQLETQQKKYEADIAKAKEYNNKLQLKYDKEIEANRKKAEDEIAKIKNYNNNLSAKEQKAEIKRINDEQKKAEADIAKAKNYNNNLSAKYDRELEASRKKAEADIAKAKNYNNNLSMKEQIAQQKIAETKKKTTLDEQIATAKVVIARNTEASAMSTSLGRAQLKSKQLIAELAILKKAEQTEENIARIQKLQNSISMQGATIRAARYQEAEKLQKMNEREADYNNVMSVHSAKRALGYTALFAGIGAVTGAFGAMISNVMEADLQMRTLGAVLKLNLTQARDLSESVRTLGETYGGSLKDIEGVALALARAGIATKDMIPATEIVLRMARLTGDSFEQSASAIISFQQVFGDTTNIETLGNKLAYVANMSRLSTQDIGTFANYALAAAKAVGLTEDAVGALATAFSVAGSNSSTIGTQLRTLTGIFSESSKDITSFFNGIGVSQEGMRDKLQQGGKVSNQAMRDFVDILANVDSMTFNKLTGSMDKLTVNALNLVRNNKDNIQKFMTDLENGAEGQLKAVDSILEAHRITLEKYWNSILNYSQESVTKLEEILSDNKIENTIATLTQKLSGNFVFSFATTYSPEEKATMTKQLEEAKAIKQLKEDSIKLTHLEDKINKASGEEYLKLSEEKRALLVKISDTRDSLETKSIGKSKEQLALEIQTREIEIANAKKSIEGLDSKSAKYITLTKYIREQEDALKKLSKTSSTISNAKVEGTSLSDLASDIKTKVSTGDTNVEKELLNLNREKSKVLEQINKDMESYYNNAYKNNKEDIAGIKTTAGATNELVASKEGLLKLQEDAIAKMVSNDALIANINDKTLNLDSATKQTMNSVVEANKQFIYTYNKLASLLGLQKVAMKTAEEAQKDAVDASLKQLDVEGKIETAQKAKSIYTKGGSELEVKKEELNILRKTIESQNKVDTSAEGIRARSLQLASKEEEVAKAINTEKNKGASADDKASKELYRRLEAEKAIASLNLEISQYQEGSYGTALGQAQVAKLELDFANKNLETAIQAKAEATEIAKLKRDISKAELESLKANDQANKQALEQKQAWQDIGLAWQQFLDQDTSPLNEALISAQNNARKIQEQIEAGGLNSIDLEKKKQELAQAQLDIEKQRLAIEIERIDLLQNSELRALEAQTAQLERMSIIRDSMATTENDNINNALKFADTLSSTASKDLALQQDRINLDKQYAKDRLDTTKNQAEVEAKYLHEDKLLKEKAKTSEIAGYGQVAGAIGAMFKQGSKEAEAFQRIQAGLAMVNAVNAVLMAGATMPTPANFASMATMVGLVTTVLANASIAFGGIGGVKTTTSSDSLSAIKANTGTGTVLGDTEAQSESIQKSLDILKDYAKPEYQLLSSMNKYLSHIASGIGGVSSLLIQEGGFAFGQGFQSTDSGWKNKVSADSSAIKGAGVIGAGVQDFATLTAGGVGIALPVALGTMLVDKYLLGGTINKLTSKLLGGIFGKTSVSSKMTDSGIYFADQLLTEATKNFVGSAYQTVETTTTKKSWFSKSSSTSSKTSTSALSDQTNRQFTMVIDNLYKTTLLAGEALDTATSTVEDRLKNFVVSIGKVSLYKKSGAEIQQTLEAVFGKLGDQIAATAYPLLRGFQQVGEGMFTTMTRVATGMEEAGYYISKLGYQFKDISYWEIWNKQGNVGFEALRQSIERTEGVTYGFNNSLLQVISSMEGTAEELYGAYTALDTIRGRLKFLGQELNGMTSQMIKGAGGVDALSSGFEAFFEGFLDDSEQLAYSTRVIANEFAKLNQAIPLSKQGFRDLLEGIDLTTASGQELYGRLITLSEGFANVAEQMEENIKSLEAQLVDKSKEAFDKFVTTLNDVYSAVEGMIDRTQSLIDNITDEASDEDLYTKLVKYNKLFDEFAVSEDEDTYDAILKLSESLAKDEDVLPSVLTRLNKTLGTLTDRQRVTRVNIIDGLGDLLGLNSQQLQQLQQGVSDGKLTNTELSNITGLTVEQKNGITEFAENSKTFSTENTLSSLEMYAQQQLALFKADVEKDKQNLSTSTFQYGDYVGLQEQIDIAKATGMSYGAVKPTIEALQGLSVSTNIKQDVASAIGYKGMSYDAAAATQIERLSQYINPEIITALSSIKQESATNIEKVATTRKEFAEQISTNISTIAKNSNAYTAAVNSYNYYDKKVEKTDNGDSDYKKYKALRETASATMAKYAAANNLLKGTTLPQSVESYINTGYLAPTELTPILQELTRVGVPTAEVNRLQALYANTPMKEFATGGYTGNGGVYDVAGIVHKGEYVLSQNDLRSVGGRGSVEAFVRGAGTSVVLDLAPIVQEIKALRNENENMKQLLVKIAADGTKALNTQRGILDAVSPEEVI